MGESLRVDPEGLRAHGGAFLDAADRAQQIFDRLTEALSEAGPCWGDDEPGKQFATNYTPDADHAVTGFRDLTRALRELGAAVTGASGKYDDQDVDSASRIARTDDTAGRGHSAEPPPRHRTDAAAEPATGDRSPDDSATRITRDSTDTATEDTPTRPADDTPFDGSQSPSSAASPQDATAADGTENRRPPALPKPQTPAPARAAGEQTALGDRPPESTPPPMPAAAPIRHGGQAAVSGAAGTPWSRPPATSNTPWSEGRPRPSSPPPAGPSRRPGRARRTRATVSTSRDPRLSIAEALAARRGIAVTGFDAPHVDESAVRQLAEAIDDLLDAFPTLGLRAVRIADLEDADVVLAVCNSTAVETIVLNRRWAADLEGLSALSAGPRPVYDAVVHEIGRAAADPAVRSATETR